jgi:hypothetical protein
MTPTQIRSHTLPFHEHAEVLHPLHDALQDHREDYRYAALIRQMKNCHNSDLNSTLFRELCH